MVCCYRGALDTGPALLQYRRGRAAGRNDRSAATRTKEGEHVPDLPKRKCIEPGCTRWAEPGSPRCRDHAREFSRRDRQRQFADLYNTGVWRRMRARQLRDFPLCAECIRHGKVTAATEVDHITPHKGDAKLFFDKRNLQSLCKRCHSAKTAREDGGFGNVLRERF